MLVVKIEVHSAIDGRVEEIGRTYIANDGTGTPARGNYNVAVCRRGNTGIPETIGGMEAAVRTGRVLDYHRNSYNVWRLISRALIAAFPEEQKTGEENRYPDIEAAIEWINAGVVQPE